MVTPHGLCFFELIDYIIYSFMQNSIIGHSRCLLTGMMMRLSIAERNNVICPTANILYRHCCFILYFRLYIIL